MTEQEKPENSEPEDEIEESFWFRFQEDAHRKMPFVVHSPYEKGLLKLHQERDPEENKDTCPPGDEQIQLHCLWAAEFYTPMHAEDLASAFVTLGWNKDDDLNSSSSPATWVERFRTGSYAGGWSNLGILRDTNSRSLMLGPGQKVKLPENVEYATGHMFSHSSSITCVVIGFVFEEEYGLKYEHALRENYKTHHTPLRRGWAIISPELQKRNRIAELREETRVQAKNWFTLNMPGAFCGADKSNKHFPTCEFITLKNTEPFPGIGDERDRQGWLHVLEMDHDWNTWKSEKMDGLKFSWPVLRDEKNNFHAVLSASHRSLEKLDVKIYEGDNRSGYVGFLNNKISELLSRWACLSLIRIHEERLFRIRDSKNYKASNRKTLQFLKKIQDLVSESLDISTLTQELIRFSKEKLHFRWDGDTFRPSRTYGEKEPISLTEALSSRIESRSNSLLELDRSLKELIIQQGNLLSASENIKLQRWMRWLTSIMTILTIAMAYGVLKDTNISSSQIWSFISSWALTLF